MPNSGGSKVILGALPGGVLVAAFAFVAGGFFPDAVAAGALCLAAILLVQLAVARDPFDCMNPRVMVAAGALAAYCAWTLLSVIWSDAPARAMIEFDRAWLYLLALLVGAAVPYGALRMRWTLRWITAGAVIVCVVAFVSRTFPDVFAVTPNTPDSRLSFPLTYWNSLGLLAVVGLILCIALASDREEGLLGRCLASAASPVFAATWMLTYSRGPALAGLVGFVIFLIVGRGSGLVTGLISTLVPAAIALKAAYDADLLGASDPTTSAAAAQGHDLALVIGILAVAAGLCQAVLHPLDRRLASLQVSATSLRRGVAIGAATLLAAAVAAAVVVDAPHLLRGQYERFVSDSSVDTVSEQRERLTDPGNNGRLAMWRVATDEFRDAPLTGAGAGTYQLSWERDRDEAMKVQDAHSLYLENLAELGGIGLVLLIAALMTIVVGVTRRFRGSARVAAAGLLAAIVVWTLEAGIDWAWEMPAVTAWVFFAGGVALASRPEAVVESALRRGFSVRIGIAVGLVVLSSIPLRVLMAESRLDAGIDAFERGDCAGATASASESIDWLVSRSEPYALLGYCYVQLGDAGLGVRAMEAAIERDPGNWEYHYGFALVRAADGRDPRPELRVAQALNPREPLPGQALRRMSTDRPGAWRERSAHLPLPSG